MNRRLASTLSGAVLGGVLLFASSASAATLVGDYQLQGTHASSGPGPALTDIGSGNAFQTDTVMGVQRQALAFPEAGGLQMSPTGLGGGDYSEVVTFRFDTSDGPNYNRVLDSTDGNGDAGFYTIGGTLDFYDAEGFDHTSTPLLSDDVYATVAVVVRNSAPDVRGFVNGNPVIDFAEAYPVVADTLRFFKDDSNEDAAGAASCVRVYSGALTDAEVGAIGASPTCSAPAAPAPPVRKKKKCKKHKKHRSASSAKKKKCKKHKKR
jgi:hypothetical protein